MKLFCVLLVAVSANAATSLNVEIPSGSTTGVAFNFTVTALSGGGGTDTAYAGTVHFTSDDSTAVLPPDYTFVPGDAGTHTFSATMNSAGPSIGTANHTIKATDVANSAVYGINGTTVRWNDNVVRTFSLVVPTVDDRTVPYQVEVRALNASLVVVPSYTGTIRFVAYHNETVPPDYTFTPADAGRHTFSITPNFGSYSSVNVVDTNDSGVFGGSRVDVRCPELVAMPSNNGPVCPGAWAMLFGNANLPVISYSWAFITPSGHVPLISSDQNIVGGPGTYILGVRQSNDCTATAQTTVTVHTPDAAQVTLSTNALCGPGNLKATITNASEYSNLKWTAVGGTIVGGQGTPSVEIAPDSGSTRISLSLGATETSSGCDASRFVAEVPVGNGMTAAVSTAATACAQVAQSASVADAGSGATYVWTITNGAITSGAGTRTIQYVPNGTGAVTLGATITNGSCSASGSAAVAVDAPTAVIENRVVGLCSTSEATIEVMLSGAPPFRIIWSDGTVQENVGTLTASRTVSGDGSYWIAQVSDVNCAGRASGITEVSVTAKPAITAQPQGSTIRSGGSATLSIAATGAGLRYRWYEGRSGDRTKLVTVRYDPSFTTPSLSSTTSYWVEVVNDCGSEESRVAVVTVASAVGKRRAVQH
jgi:hypothetical protein